MIKPFLLGRTTEHARAIRFAQGHDPTAEQNREIALTALVIVLASALGFVAAT